MAGFDRTLDHIPGPLSQALWYTAASFDIMNQKSEFC